MPKKPLPEFVPPMMAKGKLRLYGYVGSGFSEKGLKDALERMKPLYTEESPFVSPLSIKEEDLVGPVQACLRNRVCRTNE